jgi:hypothetical protein
MAESTSPSITRSPHKVEYTPCINTTLLSPTSITTYHSSFDFISEPRDCDTLNQDINPTYRTLDRDLRRLDIDSNQRTIDPKIKKLDRAESISLPTTPTEQITPPYEHKYPRLLALKNELDNSNDNDDYYYERSFALKSPTDYISSAPEQDFPQQIPDESMSNSKRLIKIKI